MKIISVHTINNDQKLDFDPLEYSKFKFGCKNIARKYGTELAEMFWTHFDDPDKPVQLVVLSSPYAHIPTATYAMKDYFVRRLNELLVEHGYPVIQEAKIYRTVTYTEDYGDLDAEQRMKLIGGDKFYVDEEFLRGKLCLFIDDIRISGSHERVVSRMIAHMKHSIDYYFLYYAVLDGKVGIHPNIENKLNYAYVKSLVELSKIINSGDFLLNTRVVKYILNCSPAPCRDFLNYQGRRFLETLYHAAIGNGYHLVKEYETNFNYLKKLVHGPGCDPHYSESGTSGELAQY